ncbi:MAG: thiamine phosphate synthase [Muribaculaceae bacterium]
MAVKIVLFTHPGCISHAAMPLQAKSEAELLTLFLQNGLDFLHIRKPEWNREQVGDLISQIPACYHCKIKIHDHFSLAEHFNVGVVVNSRNPEPPTGLCHVARSMHSLQELSQAGRYEYVTISPVFNSISKSGYTANANLTDAPHITGAKNIVALGGVTMSSLKLLNDKGFYGAALLGEVWNNGGAKTLLDTLRRRNMALYFITNGATAIDTIVQAKNVVDGGCRTVQVRMKDAPEDEIREVLQEVAPYVHEHGGIIIVDDHVSLAAEGLADGVHIGKTDMKPEEARIILGDMGIIGFTANSIEDIRATKGLPVDYLGIGPLRETTTKKNAAAPLGLETYQSLKKGEDYVFPYVAIGSVGLDDVCPLMNAGAVGVAVSGAIAKAENPAEMTRKFIELSNNYNNYLEWIP